MINQNGDEGDGGREYLKTTPIFCSVYMRDANNVIRYLNIINQSEIKETSNA